ncbi:MAG: hypothetical protein NXI24_08790 [bacterium]|nr:hypothetical protein [bacterium]
MNQHIFLCDAERAAALGDELRAAGVSGEMSSGADGAALFVEATAIALNSDSDPEMLAPALAFARQSLPNAELFADASVNHIVRCASQAVIEACDDAGDWALHILRAEDADAPGPNRARLLRSEIEAQLKKRRRRLLRSLAPDDAPVDVSSAPTTLVQLYLESRERTWLSIVRPGAQASSDAFWRRCLSPWPGGLWQATENREPPSRAYRKLAEALEQFPWIGGGIGDVDSAGEGPPGSRGAALAIQAGDRVVDLGASPGGWSWVALQRGARVLAVDRSPLRADLMQHAKLDFVQGDAFQYRPESPVDWLICDVIAFPDRILELLRDWVAMKRCRNFCVTVKFRGAGDYGVLVELKNMLNKHARDFALRRLSENKNEVTAFGCL